MPKPRIGRIQLDADSHGDFAGIGFVVYGNDGSPVASFGFPSEADAETAAGKMRDILALAREVVRTA